MSHEATEEVQEPEFRHRLLPDSSQADGSLRQVAVRGMAWTTSTRMLSQIVQLVGTAIVSRILLPSDYGLAALVFVFSGFANLFVQMGLGAAIVQTARLTEAKLSTAFWMSATASYLLMGLLIALSAPIADLFGEPELRRLIVIGSFTFAASLSVVHLAILQRALRFRALGLIDLGAALTYLATTVVLANQGVGAASLVYGAIGQQVFMTCALWSVVRWRPHTRPRRKEMGELWSYGGSLFGFTVLNYWGRNADNLLVGKVLGAASLGLYARAYNLMLLPVQQVNIAMGRVLFATYSRLVHDTPRLRSAYLRSAGLLITIGAPVSVGLAVAAPALIEAMYGPNWTGAAPLLAILALSGPAQILSGSCYALYQATGRTRQQFRRGFVTIAMTVVGIAIGLSFGPKGVATGVAVALTANLPVITRGVWPSIGVTWTMILGRVRGPLLAAAIMGAAALGIDLLLGTDTGPVPTLLSQAAVGVATYTLALLVLDRHGLIETLSAVGLGRIARRLPGGRAT